MHILTTSEAIRHAIDRSSVQLPIIILERYAALLETEPIAWVFVVQVGDSAELLEQLRGMPFASWEYIEKSDGWFEAVFIISDDGYGHVVLLPDQPEIDTLLLEPCQTFATVRE